MIHTQILIHSIVEANAKILAQPTARKRTCQEMAEEGADQGVGGDTEAPVAKIPRKATEAEEPEWEKSAYE